MTGAEVALSVVSDTTGLEALRPEWDRLVLAASRPCPFLLHGWVSSWWRHFGDGSELAVITARRASKLVGVAPMFIRRHHGLRACRLLGDHESALGDLLVAPEDDGGVARGLMARLSELRFEYLDVFGAPAGGVLTRLAAEQNLTDVPRVEAPVLRMPDGWESAYAARKSPKQRAVHRRLLRKLEELGALTWTTARTPDEVDVELQSAFEIHARRWRGRPDGSTFGQASGHAFHCEAARSLAMNGAVRILTLRMAGRPIAFQYSFLLARTIYVHRVGFDPELARFSPGRVTLLRAISDASSEGARRVEFLGGNEWYKRELADHCEPLHQVIGMPRGLLGHLATRALLFNITARMRLKQSPVLHRLYMDGLSPLRRMTARFTGHQAT